MLHKKKLKSLATNLDSIYEEVKRESSHEDIAHFKKIELWGRLSTVFGYLTALLIPNPLSAFLISTGKFTRWTVIAHHCFQVDNG